MVIEESPMNHHTALRNFVVLLLAALAAAVFVTAAHAGEFFEKDGVALRGYDAVAYVKDNQAVKGSAQLYSRDLQRQWSADVPGFVALADKQWPTAQRQTKVIE
jgi:hypothetical protein